MDVGGSLLFRISCRLDERLLFELKGSLASWPIDPYSWINRLITIDRDSHHSKRAFGIVEL